VGQAVTHETNDKKQLMPMITTIAHQSGDRPSQVLADAGYCSNESLTAIAATNIEAFIATRKGIVEPGHRADQARAGVSAIFVAGIRERPKGMVRVCTAHNILKLYGLCI
jgi:hypothetical protein